MLHSNTYFLVCTIQYISIFYRLTKKKIYIHFCLTTSFFQITSLPLRNIIFHILHLPYHPKTKFFRPSTYSKALFLCSNQDHPLHACCLIRLLITSKTSPIILFIVASSENSKLLCIFVQVSSSSAASVCVIPEILKRMEYPYLPSLI